MVRHAQDRMEFAGAEGLGGEYWPPIQVQTQSFQEKR